MPHSKINLFGPQYMWAAPKVVPFFFFKCWIMTSEVDAGDFAVRFPTNIPLYCVAVWQMAAEGQTDKIESDIEVWTKQRCA